MVGAGSRRGGRNPPCGRSVVSWLSSILVIAGRLIGDRPARHRMEEGMLDDVVGYLRCPYCGDSLRRMVRSLGCLAGHRFDIARDGYVSLLQTHIPAGAGD